MMMTTMMMTLITNLYLSITSIKKTAKLLNFFFQLSFVLTTLLATYLFNMFSLHFTAFVYWKKVHIPEKSNCSVSPV